MPATRSTRSSATSSSSPSQHPSRPSSPASQPKTDTTYVKGDFVITARGTVFRVPSYCMLAASSVLRDAHEIGSADSKFEIDLDQPAKVVKLWLDILIRHEIPPPSVAESSRLHRVLALCRQFDCTIATRTIMTGLEAALGIENGCDDRVSTKEYLIATATFGGSAEFTKGVRERYDSSGTSADPGAATSLYVMKGLRRNPATWSLRELSRLPTEYCWALVRSYHVSQETGANQADKLKVLLEHLDKRGLDKASISAAPDLSMGDE